MHAAHAQMMHLLVLVGTGGDAHQGAVFLRPDGYLTGQQAVIQGDQQPAGVGQRRRQQILLDGMARQTGDPHGAPGGQQSLVGVDHHHLPALFMQLPDEVLTYLVGAHYHHMALQGAEVR